MASDGDSRTFRRNYIAIAPIAVLLSVFALTVWLSIGSKSATADEPLHLMGAFMSRHYADHRVDSRDPPLFHYWATLAIPRSMLAVDTTSSKWSQIPAEHWHDWEWSVETLYRTPGNDADWVLMRARGMMLVAALAGAALIALWSWRTGGPVAAVVATVLVTFDPNFLAHSGLLKNDAALSFAMLWVAYATWRVGERITPWRVANLCLAVIVCINVKFSGLLCAVIVPALLLVRALLPNPWERGEAHAIQSRAVRFAAAVALTLVIAVASYAAIWALYRFRFDPTPQPSVRLAMAPIVEQAAERQIQADHPNRRATPEELAAWKPPLFVRAVLWSESHRFFPQAWLHGLLYTYQSTYSYPAFLLDRYSRLGWWYYFPLAVTFKTPIATLIVLFATGLIALLHVTRAPPWTAICLSLPVLFYGYNALTTNTNLGIRHVLPLFPFLYIAAGIIIARLLRRPRRWTRFVVPLVLLGIAIESLLAFPNYIPFFNAAAAPHRLSLLSDSNLDWGQDLKLLARWQRRNPKVKLYLCYFGMADPAYYGIRYTPLPGSFMLDGSPQLGAATGPGVIAISATHLQGTFLPPDLRKRYARYRRLKPRQVLGDSIYLFDYGEPALAALEPQPRAAVPQKEGQSVSQSCAVPPKLSRCSAAARICWARLSTFRVSRIGCSTYWAIRPSSSMITVPRFEQLYGSSPANMP